MGLELQRHHPGGHAPLRTPWLPSEVWNVWRWRTGRGEIQVRRASQAASCDWLLVLVPAVTADSNILYVTYSESCGSQDTKQSSASPTFIPCSPTSHNIALPYLAFSVTIARCFDGLCGATGSAAWRCRRMPFTLPPVRYAQSVQRQGAEGP